MKIPIRIYVDLRNRVEDTFFHVLDVSVIGSVASQTIAEIESEEVSFTNPRINEVQKNGLGSLDVELRDRLLTKLFRLAVSEMRSADGSAITWDIANVAKWINRQFIADDAAAILNVLGGFVSPGIEVRDVCNVRID
ncbi:MAG TPA: hypothetical protein VHS31_17185 [Tepidisphaeraceae bacterium]|jgi:hypothetical protein|nr:hypothetical protein [Tepidisphaeraceae bacterium]